MNCPRCGQHNSDDARFCSHCGQALTDTGASRSVVETTKVIPRVGAQDTSEQPEADDSHVAHAGAVESLPLGSALLVVKRGPNAGSRFLLDRDVTTAGRHPDSDIFLDDVTVSRRHVEFRREGAGFSVHDVGSLNGTYVNREPIDSASLSNQDEVQIGKFRLIYLTGGSRTTGAEGAVAEERR